MVESSRYYSRERLLPPHEEGKVACMVQVRGKWFALGIELKEDDNLNITLLGQLFDSGLATVIEELDLSKEG